MEVVNRLKCEERDFREETDIINFISLVVRGFVLFLPLLLYSL